MEKKNKNYHTVGTLMYCIGNKPVHNKILINYGWKGNNRGNQTQYQDQ